MPDNSGAPYGINIDQENPPIILLEGTDCVGKTTLVRLLQDLIPSHNLLKLSAAPGQTSNDYMRTVYRSSTSLFLDTPRNTWLVDRYTPSERVYGKIYRGLTIEQSTHLDWAEKEMSRRNAHMFLITLPEKLLAKRLELKQRQFPNEKQSSLNVLCTIQDTYMESIASEVQISNKWVIRGEMPPSDILDNIMAASGLYPHLEVNEKILFRV